MGEDAVELIELMYMLIARYETLTGQKPTAIYLGVDETIRLPHLEHAASEGDGADWRFLGIKIVRVAALNHIGVGVQYVEKPGRETE
jgi:hypothetical protein